MNLNKLYKPAINDSQASFYNDYLGGHSEEFLEGLWTKTMEKHLRSSPPSIGELHKYAESVVVKTKYTPQQIEEKRQKTEEELLDSYIGCWALRQGWASSYINYCQYNKIPKQDDSTILLFQKHQYDAKDAYESLQDDNIFSKTLKNFYHSMREKNEMLKEQYSHLAAKAEFNNPPHWQDN
jgi:hypothetical protein